MVRCSGLERSRRSKMFYCNIRTPVHRIAIPKVMWLLFPKFLVQTLGIATLWTGVSVFCNLHTAFPLNFNLCVPRPRSGFYWHRSRFRSCYYEIAFSEDSRLPLLLFSWTTFVFQTSVSSQPLTSSRNVTVAWKLKVVVCKRFIMYASTKLALLHIALPLHFLFL